ncbi:MAG: hypothetical protein HC904_04575 [Blastochloris sp.]|nr:hypothetical protein [Blastochloris sp.]
MQLCGALALDHIRDFQPLSREELEKRFEIKLDPAPLLVTLHPTTNEVGSTEEQVTLLLEALSERASSVVFTLPNADMAGRLIRARMESYCEVHPEARMVENFGPEAYFSMLSQVAAMVGNSSSGILEAASFRLPVLNVGSRQGGRLRPANVVDVPFLRDEIRRGLDRVLSLEFRESLADLRNPYGDGRATDRVMDLIGRGLEDPRVLNKKFGDL